MTTLHLPNEATPFAVPGAGGRRGRTAIVLALLILLAFGLCLANGTQGALERNSGMYLYAGQRLQAGIPPYVSVFSHKGPLAVWLAGAGVFLGRVLGVSDLLTTRLCFMLAASFALAGLYLLGRAVSDSRRVGLWAALSALCFAPYWSDAAAGPEPKTPLLPLQAFAMWLTATRRWFWAGLAGGLLALIWQPLLVFPLATLLWSLFQEQRRGRAVLLSGAGLLLPFAATTAYYAAHGALFELYDRLILFNVAYLRYTSNTDGASRWKPLGLLTGNYGMILLLALLGLAGLTYLAARRVSQQGGVWPAWRKESLPALLLPLGAALVWSVVDFQGTPDFYVFIPYLALGFGVVLDLVLQGVERETPAGGARWVAALLAAALLGGSLLYARLHQPAGLDAQIAAVQTVRERFGDDCTVLALDSGDAIALMGKVQPTVYMVFGRGTEEHIEDDEPGGYAGWLGRMQAAQPDLVFYQSSRSTYQPVILAWLRKEYRRERIGPWVVFVSRRFPPIDGATKAGEG